MAVLGNGGRLELRREAPPPCVILPEDIHVGNGTIDIGCEGYWPGDHITISGPDGLPIFIDGRPQIWDSVASYFGSSLYVADNRDQITSNTDQFYKTSSEQYPAGELGDDSWFYYRGEDENDSPVTDLSGYLCIDSLGRASIYSDRCSGLNCCGEKLLDFGGGGGVDQGDRGWK